MIGLVFEVSKDRLTDKEMETNEQEQKHTDFSKQNKNKKQKWKLKKIKIKKKKSKQVCHQAFWKYVWFDGRAHDKRQNFH